MSRMSARDALRASTVAKKYQLMFRSDGSGR
jgi:hypothetical protein